MSKFIAVFFLLMLSAAQAVAQSGDIEQVFEVSATQTWTDTGIDLKAGDSVKISATATPVSGAQACDPKGEGPASADLPLSSAAAGALIAKLHAASTPVLVGASGDLHIIEASHLFLGINASGTPPCQGGFSVKVEVTVATSATSSTTTPSTTTSSAAAQDQTRGQQ